MKPHYRLHVNLGDAKPLWWITRVACKHRTTRGYSTAAAACAAAQFL